MNHTAQVSSHWTTGNCTHLFVVSSQEGTDMDSDLVIEEWTPANPRWDDIITLAHQLDQHDWLTVTQEWHLSSNILVAATPAKAVGFLRYVIQMIGPDQGWQPLTLDGSPLLEGKVLAFGVVPAERRKGIGRLLQYALIQACRDKMCYQIRSHSSPSNSANYALKLSLGYAVHPLPYEDGASRGVYFLMALHSNLREPDNQ